MGVTGLWRLIEPAGKPVPVESLENKVLAVDISIWLHQVVKGYQDAKGAPLPNAHLMGLFQRLCKLLYFRIKPVFVFDGGFPELKRETIAKRQDNKTKYNSESERLRREIALLLGKKTAIGSLLGNQISPKKNKNTTQPQTDDIFKLPSLPEKEQESESESEEEADSSASTVDLHSVDIESDNFKNMPVKEKYDLLVELKETRKMNSWGKLHTLPKKSDNFSDFQMQRLLKRRKVQECLEETEKEMGDIGMSLNDLESLLNEEGIDTKIENLPTRRIASNNTTRYLLISNVQQALADAKKREEAKSLKESEANTEQVHDIKDESEDDLKKAIQMSLECDSESNNTEKEVIKKDELEADLEKAIKMSLECVEEPNTSACTSKTDDSWTSYKSDSDYSDVGSDSEDCDGFEQPDYSTAKAYIMQFSDFTHKTIDDMVTSKNKGSKCKTKFPKIDEIIEEINHEKSVIVDKVDVSSEEDEQSQNVNDMNSSISKPVEIKVEDNNSSESDVDKYINTNVDMDMTQSSVVCIEKPANDVITLDTSSDDIVVESGKLKPVSNISDQSESSSDEFEEVSDSEVKPTKPVVQLTLTVPDSIEDDIFADVFEKRDTNLNICSKIKNVDASKVTTTIEPKPVEVKTNKINKGSENVQKETKILEITPETKSIEENINDEAKQSSTKYNTDIAKNNSVDQTPISKETDKSEEPPKEPISTDTLRSMVADIETEEANLLQEKGRMERIGRNITEQMTRDAQELLQLFGIPYIVAPMEAEAQCAFLESVNLTDGTITDDSDIWLFGGKTVYKNFFNQKKHVLQFLSERIEKSFNLSREQLILLALLVGSDYTTGVAGVGPVTAMEILASFPFNKRLLLKEDSKHGQYEKIITGLQEFKTWVRAGKRTDNITLKKKLRNVTLGDDFPSVRVVQAYLDPNVEKSEDKFTWGKIDITILRDYAKAKFGWSQNKLDVIVQPVLKRMLENKTQKTVYDYFKKKIEFQSLEDQMSKRVKAAVQKMDPEGRNLEMNPEGDTGQAEEPKLKAGQKRKGRGKKTDSTAGTSISGVSKGKKKKIVAVENVSTTTEGAIEINVPKTDRYQEIIPQRQKDMQNILENKLKAIEIFRKTTIDRKRKPFKKKAILPKDKAELSESSDSN
ncbi:DNA excision repair protein ERCC-5 homolog [Epargyreus clarus]|uniref:DNA excision repair protein ERCC-5 homolog n=1 Tax=Epargyreus clarus TaxID=520877 RepID=UPI003C2C4525